MPRQAISTPPRARVAVKRIGEVLPLTSGHGREEYGAVAPAMDVELALVDGGVVVVGRDGASALPGVGGRVARRDPALCRDVFG